MTWKDHLRWTSSPFPFFFHSSVISLCPPHCITSWGREGRGRLSFLLAQSSVSPAVTQGAMGGATPGAKPVGLPGEGHASGRAARPALLLDARVPPLPAQPPSAPVWNMTFWTLWVEVQLCGLWGEAPCHLKAIWTQCCLQLASDLGRSLPLLEQWSPSVNQ